MSRLALLVFTAWAVALPRPADPATIVVEGSCTLVEAINAANNDDDGGGLCPPGGSGSDILEMTADVTLTAAVGNQTGLPTITSDVTIRGNGLALRREPSAERFRMFNIDGAGSLTLEELTVTGGVFESGGGGFFEGAGIRNDGQLILTNTTLSDNGDDPGLGYGGAIWNSGAGSVTLRSSTISSNQAYWGAGIYNFGQIYAFDSTFSYNVAFKYGAALLNRGTTTMTNSTVSGNSAIQLDNGIRNQGSLTLVSSTIAADSGALYDDWFYGAVTTSYDSIIFQCPADDAPIDGGNNFAIEGNCGFAQIVVGVDIAGELADNGGPTLTHALLPGSLAVDAAGACGLDNDQRGYLRDASCDSGAFELGALPPPALSLSGRCPGAMTVSIANAKPSAVTELFIGAAAGSSTIPSGLCSGTPFDIITPHSVDTIATDATGAGSLAINFDPPDCGRVLQAVDTSDCRTSDVEVVDSCHPLIATHIGDGTDPAASPPSSAGCVAGEFMPDEPISLTAAPDPGWSVAGWSGTDDDGSTSTTNSLTMPFGEHTVSVTYVEPCSPLALSHTGQGAPLVASPANSPGCPLGEYAAGESILLTAAPDPGWGAGSWSGTDNDASTDSTNTVTMPAAAHAASVDYVELCYTLSLGHTGAGSDPLATPLGDQSLWTRHDLSAAFDGVNSALSVDLDQDGDADVLAAAGGAGEIRWWENAAGDGSAWVERLIATFPGARSPVIADIDGDGDPDLAAATQSGSQPAWFENTAGDASAWTVHTVNTGFQLTSALFAADVNGDLSIDLVVISRNLESLSWLGNSAGDGSSWTEHVIVTGDRPFETVVAADLDGDLDIDVATGEAGNKVSWFENAGGDGGLWVPGTVALNSVKTNSLSTADIDGDGDLDLLGTAELRFDVSWWEKEAGDGSVWTTHFVESFIDSPNWAEAADLDRDGDLDVVAARKDPSDLRWYENLAGDGIPWAEHGVTSDIGGAWVVTTADVDGDIDIDLVGAGESEVAWWENTSPAPECPAGTFHFGDPISLAAAPDPDWEVAGWTGTDDDTSTEVLNSLSMPASDHTVAVTYVESSPSGPQLLVSGTCPGEVTIGITTAQPDEQVSLFAGPGEGSTVIPGGPCAGTELDLAGARSNAKVTTDGNGEATLVRIFGANWCDRFLQAIDQACTPGNVDQLP